MYSKLAADHPLRRLFGGLVEQVFMTDLGVCDTRLTTYLSELLCDFVHVDQIYQLHRVDGSTIREVSQMEADAFLGPHPESSARARLVNRFIGDFTLFWAGLYPEALRPRRSGADRLREYLLQGKRSYHIAGDLSEGDSRPPAEVLRRLSQEFECCVHGLQLVRSHFGGGLGGPVPHDRSIDPE